MRHLVLLWAVFAAPLALAQDYDLREVRGFLDGIANGISGYEHEAVWHPSGDTICIGQAAIDAWTGQRRELDTATAIAAARAAGADASTPQIEPSDEPCSATLKFGTSVFDADLLTGAVKPHYDARKVRVMFPMFHWDRRENLSPDGAWFQTLIGDDIGVRAPHTDEAIRFTTDGAPNYQYFQAYDIWERAGEQWSRDSTRFVGRRHDTRSSKGLLLLDTLGGKEALRHFTYWTRTGDALPVTTLFVFDVRARTKVALSETGTPDSYLFFLDWSPDGKRIAYVRVARDLRRYELFEADAATGVSVRLLEEVAKSGIVKWPQAPKTFHYLPDGRRFLWRSDRDGYAGYYLYARDQRAPHKVSPDGYEVSLVAIEKSGDALILSGAPDPVRPFDERLLRWRFSGRKAAFLSDEKGVHEAQLSPSGKFLLDKHHDIDRPPTTVIRRASDGSIVATVQRASLKPSLAALPAAERIVATAADGKTQIHGVLYKPVGFDPAKRYPVIERIYGGMQLNVAPHGFPALSQDEYDQMLLYFAARGFVVVMLDAPGTLGRGREYSMARYGTWPDGIIADHAAALRGVAKARPWMDLTRIGLDGNSFGGMLALRGALEAPDLYRAVAASVPQTDLIDSITWIEWKLGALAGNRAAYERGALAPRMKDLRTPLLLVGGTSDVNVTFSNLTTLLDALAEAGKPYELVLLPETNHTHDGRGDRYAYAIAAITRFFSARLGTARE